MARKRKSEATRLDEVDRTLYSTFCSAANSLSQVYTQAMNQQKLSFQAGERHALCSHLDDACHHINGGSFYNHCTGFSLKLEDPALPVHPIEYQHPISNCKSL